METTTSLNISLPQSLKKKVQSRVKKCDYSNASDYVRHLIRADVAREAAQDEIRTLLKQGVVSGVSGKAPQEVFAELKTYIAQKA